LFSNLDEEYCVSGYGGWQEQFGKIVESLANWKRNVKAHAKTESG
jgi:hypothetical protein